MKARENPFISRHIDRLAFRFREGESWETLLDRLSHLSWRGAIVGPHGSGKTTLIEQLAPRLEAREFHPRLLTIRADHTFADKQATLGELASLQPKDFLLVDGAEQLTTRQWLSVTTAGARCSGLVITQHRGGRLPTAYTCEPDVQLLENLVVELTEAWLPDGEAHRLFTQYRGNIRDCFRDLYDRYAG